jgi:aminoglycoside phosphotransferase family enzyme
MLDRAIDRGDWTPTGVEAVLVRLVRFHADARRPVITPAAYRARLAADIDESRRELATFGTLDRIPDEARAVAGRLHVFLDRNAGLFDERVAHGRIVEGHGDLRPEHIFLGPPPAIIDCIEFNPSFRELDAVDDVAFLCLECERMGAPDLGRFIGDAYAALAADSAAPRLAAFHRSRRALLRAKIALWHLHEDHVDRPGSWIARAREYLALARRHAPT